ncbi:MAG: hypothetical protein GY737_03905 [Desulfobacteraceae bacterium]|nr:hypothetical protein [Desulfobacteraceae bacterium]
MTSVHLTVPGNGPAAYLSKTPARPHAAQSPGAAPEPSASQGRKNKVQASMDIPAFEGPSVSIEPLKLSPELKELAATIGVSEDKFGSLIKQLNDQDREKFLSGLAKSGDSARKFFITTDRLKGEKREAFLAFADQLSKEGLEDFLTAVNNSPKDRKAIMEIASNLTDKNLDNYLSAAAKAGRDVEILNDEVNDRLDKSEKSTGMEVNGFLSAAAKSGSFVIKLIEKSHEVSPKTADKILDFINTQEPGEELDNFLQIMEKASESSLNTIIDISPELTGQERKELLKTASRLGKDLDRFTGAISTLAGDHSGYNPTGLSDFIITAGKAGKQVGKLLELSGRIDLGITSKLSTVDTANFLVAAEKADGQLPLLTELTQALAGNDRSNLLYGMAYTDVDPEKFLSQVKNMGEEVRSDFLLSAANQGQEEVEHGIFMKGILSAKAYEDFKATASTMGEGRLEELVAVTNELDETDRTNFLKMASTAGDSTDKLLHVVTIVSGTDRKEFLDVGSNLVEDDLENFIKAAETAASGPAPDLFSDFVGLSRELDGYELSNYLKAGAQAEPDVLDDLTDFTKELINKELVARDDKRQKKLDPVKYYARIEETQSMRFNFLEAASKADQNLKGLIDMGRGLILDRNEKLADKFFSSSAVSEKYLGAFIRTYA